MVEERSPNLPAFVLPAGMLADLVAICWPEDVVRRALEQTGSHSGHGTRRADHPRDGQETMRATLGGPGARWTGRLSYRNVRAGYTVDVQSVEQP